MEMNRSLMVSAVAAALLGADVTYGVGVNDVLGDASFTTNHANFTMLGPTGATVNGANNVNMTWDGDAFTASSDYTGPGSYSNVTVSSTSFFFNYRWTAHDIQMFLPGSYSFDTTLGGGNPEAGMLNATVGAGQLGMHMLFDWNGNNNIDVFVVFAQNSLFGAGVVRGSANATDCDSGLIQNCLWDTNYVTGFKPTANQVWMLATVDGNGDGVMGIPMVAGGPFAGFNAGFNANMDPIACLGDIGPDCGIDIPPPPVPVPAAAWLFGSGLAGLLGIAHQRKSMLGSKKGQL